MIISKENQTSNCVGNYCLFITDPTNAKVTWAILVWLTAQGFDIYIAYGLVQLSHRSHWTKAMMMSNPWYDSVVFTMLQGEKLNTFLYKYLIRLL